MAVGILGLTMALGFSGCQSENQKNQDAYRKIGINSMAEGDYDKAVKSFQKALDTSLGKIGAEEIDICYYKAAAQFAKKDYDGAIETYTSLIDYDKENANAYYLRGSVYLDTDKKDKAVYKTGTMDDPTLTERLYESGAKFTKDIQKTMSPLLSGFLSIILPLIIFIGLGQYISRKFMDKAGGSNALSFGLGKSNAKIYVQSTEGISFDDVAGEDEAKESLAEIVDYLHNPKKYTEVGASMPKGVLLVGPPGTGKTMLAKAVAGESKVPFFSMSGSEFVEMFVGMGASKVRDLFKQAKEKAPCIVFIDEIDAIGKKRDGNFSGNDEREQTLNQLLTEMDGFEGNTGVIILAATNRPDVLDPALLRPGRFDRQVVIGIPDVKGREEIFKVHSKNKPLDNSVDAGVLARRTPGFTPADIENLLNEAALLAARRNGRTIRMEEIEEAITKVIAGPEKKSRVINEEERKLTAYHEAGHAVVARSLPKTDPVHQITIIPRGRAGGFTMTLPKEDRSYGTRQGMREQILHLLGGRVAEMLTLEDISTGASNDIQRATDIARDMITKYGFSERLGTVNYSDSEEVFLGRDFTSSKKYSEEVAAEIDEEIRRMIGECLEDTKEILKAHMTELENVAQALLLVETLDGEQFERLFTGEITPEALADELNIRRQEQEIKDEEEQARALKEEEEDLARYDGDYLSDDDIEEDTEETDENPFKSYDEIGEEEDENEDNR